MANLPNAKILKTSLGNGASSTHLQSVLQVAPELEATKCVGIETGYLLQELSKIVTKQLDSHGLAAKTVINGTTRLLMVSK